MSANLIAPKKLSAAAGKLSAKIIVVAVLPSSGVPEVNSNTEPTAAIAAIQESPRNNMLFGVAMEDASNVKEYLNHLTIEEDC